MAGDDARGITLPPMPAERARTLLARAMSGADGVPAATLATRAAGLAVPLVVLASTPAGRRRLARAVHALGGRAGPLVTGFVPATGCPAPSTLLVDVTAPGPDVATLLECVADDGEPWLLIGASALADLPDALRSSLAASSVELPALDPDAVVEAARETLRALAPIGEAPVLGDDAAAWLATRPDARDPEELALWLRRATSVAAAGAALDARLLVAIAPPPPPPAPVEPGPAPVAGEAGAAARLEFVLAELAHELRNPLVTLKTMADHLDDLAADEELRARFAGLAGEAIGRMDDLLDNLVSYGRLGAPDPRPLDVAGLLDAAVRDAAPALAERGLSVRAAAGDAACLADPQHLGFALKNLLVGIARAAAPGGEVVVDATTNGVVRLRFASDADAATLRRLFTTPDDVRGLYDPTYQPLPFSLARAVLEKVGGRVDVAPAREGGTALEMHLPVAERPA